MQTQHSVLGYRIDLYFHDYKPAIQIHEKEHSNRNIDYEIKRQKAKGQNLVVSSLELTLTRRL